MKKPKYHFLAIKETSYGKTLVVLAGQTFGLTDIQADTLVKDAKGHTFVSSARRKGNPGDIFFTTTLRNGAGFVVAADIHPLAEASTNIMFNDAKEAYDILVSGKPSKDKKPRKVTGFRILPAKARKGVTDSMLLDSGQEVFGGTVDGVEVYVIVTGEVQVEWKDGIYTRPSEFPDDLKEYLRSRRFADYESNDCSISMNNWYESRVEMPDGRIYDEIVEMDLDKISVKEAKAFLLSIAENYI